MGLGSTPPAPFPAFAVFPDFRVRRNPGRNHPFVSRIDRETELQTKITTCFAAPRRNRLKEEIPACAAIQPAQLDAFRAAFERDPHYRASLNAVSKNPINNVA